MPITPAKHECDYPYPHDPAACALYAQVEAKANRAHPYADDNGIVRYPPGSGDAAIKFLSRYTS